jgi:hypothetical protein
MRVLAELLARIARAILASTCNHCGGRLPCREHDGAALAALDAPWPRGPRR